MARRTARFVRPSLFKYCRFALIDENDGYFVSRLKESANPMVTEELREWRGRDIPLAGEQIHDVVGDLHREYIDVEVEVEFDRQAYAGTQSRDTKRFRVVGVRNEDADDYHLYITNLLEILLYAALLSLLVSRDLLDLVTEQADDEFVFPPERWAATFRSHAQLILHELGEYLSYSPPPLLERVIDDVRLARVEPVQFVLRLQLTEQQLHLPPTAIDRG